MTDIIRVIRIISYEGPREWVERTLETSVHGTRIVRTGPYGECKIHAVTLGTIPELLSSTEND